MPEFNAADFGRRIDAAKTLGAAQAVFDDVARLSPADQKAAVDLMEEAVVSDWLRTAPKAAELAQLRMVLDMIDGTKGTPEGDMLRRQIEKPMPVDASGIATLVMRGLKQYKGDEAHEIVKLFVEALDSQPADEANTGFGFAKLMVAVQEKFLALGEAKPAVRPNPFRKPSAPGNFDF